MRKHRLALAALVLPFFGGSVLAQAPGARWSLTPTPADPPSRRENPGAADDNYMYVFGGTNNSTGVAMNDLWRFDGSTWTQMTADGAAGSPPARTQAGVTWNWANSRLTVFGGRDLGGTILGDTWEWDPITNTWADVTPAGISPTPRRWCALAMDPVNSTVLLFGGNDAGGTYLGDTWQFDGTSWTELFPGAPLPPVRQQHILVERPDQPDVILAVGQNSGGMLKDTWTWNGSSWTEIVTANPPGASAAIDAAYDQIRGRIVFPSGMPGPTGLISEFDTATSDWIQRPLDTGIYKVTRYFLAYIPAVGKTFKVSGQALNPLAPADKTYEYQSDVVATLSTSLAGCPGGGGVPTLSVSGALWIGDSFTVDVTNVAPTEIVLLLGGLSNTIWLGVPLPLDLTGVLGNPGCLLYVAPDPILSVGLGLGPVPATYAATVPTTVAVSHVGLQFYYQAIVIDALTFQGAASDLATCVLGLK